MIKNFPINRYFNELFLIFTCFNKKNAVAENSAIIIKIDFPTPKIGIKKYVAASGPITEPIVLYISILPKFLPVSSILFE